MTQSSPATPKRDLKNVSSSGLPEMVHPPVPGETHPYYGDYHNSTVFLTSVKQKIQRTPEFLARQEALYSAAEQGDLEALQALLLEDSSDEPLDINLASTQTGLTALHYAASRGHLQIVQVLIDQCGSLVDAANREGETALLKAAYYGHFSVVHCLIYRRTNIHHRDKDGWTALHNACARGHFGIVRILVELGKADVNCKNLQGYTPLMNAASKGFSEIVEYLLVSEKGDPLIKNQHGETAYDAAAANRYANICEMLETAERDWWIRPNGEAVSYTGAYDLLGYHNTVLIMIHENERAYQSFSSYLTSQPIQYSSSALTRADRRAAWTRPPSNYPCRLTDVGLPDGSWHWLNDWEIDRENVRSDIEGWEYARNFDDSFWGPEISGKVGVRRRRWIRVMKKHFEIDGITLGKVEESTENNYQEKILDAASFNINDGSSSQKQQETSISYDSWADVQPDFMSDRPKYSGANSPVLRIRTIQPQEAINSDLLRLRGGSSRYVDDFQPVLRLRGGGGPDQQVSVYASELNINSSSSSSFASANSHFEDSDHPVVVTKMVDLPTASTSNQSEEQSNATVPSNPWRGESSNDPTATSSSSFPPALNEHSLIRLLAGSGASSSRRRAAAANMAADSSPASGIFLHSGTPTIMNVQQLAQYRERGGENHSFFQSWLYSDSGTAATSAAAPVTTTDTNTADITTVDTNNTTAVATPVPENTVIWESDEEVKECRCCRKRFTFWLRRHHCRRCGLIFCDRCTSYRASVPSPAMVDRTTMLAYPSLAAHQRVCEACYHALLADDESIPVPRRRNSESSIMLDCPVCGRALEHLHDRSSQELHVKDCIEHVESGGTKVAGLRYIAYKVDLKSPMVGYECPICFEDFEIDAHVARLNCLCTYHRQCIDQWLARGKGCPVHQSG